MLVLGLYYAAVCLYYAAVCLYYAAGCLYYAPVCLHLVSWDKYEISQARLRLGGLV